MQTIVIVSAAIAAVTTYGAVMLHYSAKRDKFARNRRGMDIADSFGAESTWQNRKLWQDHKNLRRREFYDITTRRDMLKKTVRVVP